MACVLGTPLSEVTTHNGVEIVQGEVIGAAADVDIASLDAGIRERLLLGEDGNLYVARLHLRMLDARREITRLMGFPADYKWPQSKTKITKLSGNAVHVDWAYAHVKAFLADWVPSQQSEEESAA